MSEDYTPAAHYDRVTEAWGLLLGEELHYGVFATGAESLPAATAALTTAMISAARFEPRHRLLDVGCGTGGPARRVARELGVSVLGITTSPVGVATASALSQGLDVSFEVRDGLDNGLADASFDRAWALESSHLMPDRRRLANECARVLRPGGRFVLCDIIRRRDIAFSELRRRTSEFATLRRGLGEARMDSFDEYRDMLSSAGLVVDEVLDLTESTRPTFERWRENLDTHREAVSEVLDVDDVAAFEDSLDILSALWDDGTLGYGLVSAVKPG